MLWFGSYSSPSFRQRAPLMIELARDYSTRANFLIIYTKESHPKDGWQVERNKDDNIEITTASDLNARKATAKLARDSLKLSSLAIAVDSIDDKTLAAYNAQENSLS